MKIIRKKMEENNKKRRPYVRKNVKMKMQIKMQKVRKIKFKTKMK